MKKEAAIVVLRCQKKRSMYGVRFEKIPASQTWLCTWAFPLKESSARREGYDRVTLSGNYQASPEFPGCPYCHTKNFFLCSGCNKLGCWNGEDREVTCPWCGAQLSMGGSVESITGGDY